MVYIIECELVHPAALHDSHNDSLHAAGRRNKQVDMLSYTQLHFSPHYARTGTAMHVKLVANRRTQNIYVLYD